MKSLEKLLQSIAKPEQVSLDEHYRASLLEQYPYLEAAKLDQLIESASSANKDAFLAFQLTDRSKLKKSLELPGIKELQKSDAPSEKAESREIINVAEVEQEEVEQLDIRHDNEALIDMPVKTEKKADKVEPIIAEPRTVNAEEPSDFLSWIKTKNNKEVISPTRAKPESEQQTELPQSPADSINEKIQAFIDDQIAKSTNKEVDSTHAESPISETLAQILEKQGKKEQAIAMYKALSLKFPEKSSFFAGRIKML